MESHEVSIQGMSCSHCIMHIKHALETIDGLKLGDVQIGKARVYYEDEKIASVLIEKIKEAGYQVNSIQ